MRPLQLKLGPGSDLRRSLEQLAIEQGASGFVLGVVGNLSRATFQCAGRSGPTVLEGDLEIITLQGTVAPQGVHLHLSLSDGDCQVWGGHLESGTLVLKGADLLVGFLPHSQPANAIAQGEVHGAFHQAEQPRVEVAVLSSCPWSKRALRMLRTLGIHHQVQTIATDAERRQLEQRSGQSTLPQVFIDGQLIGGYDDLAELQGRGGLDRLRSS
jgi:predicted DNA-binding protein with PD1-like motif/glutaredoxin